MEYAALVILFGTLIVSSNVSVYQMELLVHIEVAKTIGAPLVLMFTTSKL